MKMFSWYLNYINLSHKLILKLDNFKILLQVEGVVALIKRIIYRYVEIEI